MPYLIYVPNPIGKEVHKIQKGAVCEYDYSKHVRVLLWAKKPLLFEILGQNIGM